jgi:hypothetical protein
MRPRWPCRANCSHCSEITSYAENQQHLDRSDDLAAVGRCRALAVMGGQHSGLCGCGQSH